MAGTARCDTLRGGTLHRYSLTRAALLCLEDLYSMTMFSAGNMSKQSFVLHRGVPT